MTMHNDRAREDTQAQEHHAHVDQYAQIAHELPESTAEALSRTIIRVVPLAYGVLFGLLIDRLWQGRDRKNHQIMAAHVPALLHPSPRRVPVSIRTATPLAPRAAHAADP